MTITNVSPLMQKAFREEKQLYVFADLWKSVLNDSVDSQAEFALCPVVNNIDFDTSPGFARLAKQSGAFTITQSEQNATQVLTGSGYGTLITRIVMQGFNLELGRKLFGVTVKIDNNPGTACTITYKVVRGTITRFARYADAWGYIQANTVCSATASCAANYDGDVTAAFDDVDLTAGLYTLVVYSSGSGSIYYTTNNPYSGGEAYLMTETLTFFPGASYAIAWADLGDLYFTLNLSGYYSSGTFRTPLLDMGETPPDTGEFRLSESVPVGTSREITLYAYATAAAAAAGTVAHTITNAEDGQEVPAYPYWDADVTLNANDALDETPMMDTLELLYPKDRIRMRQRGEQLHYVHDEILSSFQPFLVPSGGSPSEMKIIERVSSIGRVGMDIVNESRDAIQRLVSDSPLKNFRAALYLGADVPGFRISDLFRYFIGTVDKADVTPQYERDVYKLSISIKNTILELKRKVPLPEQTGLLNYETIAINYDKTHVTDAQVDLMRGKGSIPARYMNMQSFLGAKGSVGSGSPDPAAHVIRRSNSLVRYPKGAATPNSANTGDGKITDISADTSAVLGVYAATCTVPAAGAGTFSVTNPAGVAMAAATAGTAYSDDGLSMLIRVGDVDYIAGDSHTLEIISPDTRIKSPEELVKLLTPLCVISDGYITVDEGGRLKYIQHDPDAVPEATWADRDMVLDGVDAIRIEDIGQIDLGYTDLLFNLCLTGCEWDGSGTDWRAFKVYSYLDSTSADEWAPGKALYLSAMEANMLEVSKFLGPENGYNGETLAQAIATRMVNRHKNPPARIKGAVLPVSQFMRGQGAVIKIWSKEFCKRRRRCIALSETFKFMITSQAYDQRRNRMIFDLIELQEE